MPIELGNTQLTVGELVQIARFGEKVELHRDSVERIKTCRIMLEDKIEAGEVMYGVNTGIGEFSEVVLDDDQIQVFHLILLMISYWYDPDIMVCLYLENLHIYE